MIFLSVLLFASIAMLEHAVEVMERENEISLVRAHALTRVT